MMIREPQFLFTTCQIGAEAAVKGEIARRLPAFRFSYSRAGFLTFKLPAGHGLPADFDLESVFARAHGFVLGKVAGTLPDEMARDAWDLAADVQPRRLHAWQRDLRIAGDRGYTPGQTLAAAEAYAALTRAAADRGMLGLDPTALARAGERVLDCVMVGPGEWWLGYHQARVGPSCWPGGLCEMAAPPDMVSRAFLKMEEALAWSQLPLRAGEEVAELGCSPGGSCQALLARGLVVTGIDPAEVSPTVLAHPRFRHLRKRGADVRRREFRKTRWLAADMNVAPAYTLDAVEGIVTHAEVHIRGLLLTLKLLDWSLADEIPSYLERIRSWGYDHVQARQLHHGRQEICVVATRSAERPAKRRAHGSRGRRARERLPRG